MMGTIVENAKDVEMVRKVEEMEQLKEENQKLKQDNEMLLKIVVQMKGTLNRMVSRYVLEESKRQHKSEHFRNNARKQEVYGEIQKNESKSIRDLKVFASRNKSRYSKLKQIKVLV